MHNQRKEDISMKKLACALLIMIGAFASQDQLSHIITPRGGSDPESDNKTLVQKFYDAFESNDAKEMNEYLASNYGVQDSNVVFDSSYSKYDAFSKNLSVRLTALHEALPKFKLSIIEMLADGNKVVARIQIQGVQRGSFLGIEPTNKPVVIKEFVILTIEGGKITHLNEVWNELGVMKQIGYIAI